MEAESNLKNHWLDFSRETSLDGWSFLSKPGLSWIRRLFWIIAVIGSVSGAVFFNLTFLNEFFAATVLVTVKSASASLNNVIFPSIVVCNHNQVKISGSMFNSTHFTKVTESVAIELRLNEKEVEIMLDYFKYGKERFSIEEMAFINGNSPSIIPIFYFHPTALL